MIEVFDDIIEKVFQIFPVLIWVLENEELLLRSFDRVDAILTSYEWEKETNKIQAKRSPKKSLDLKKEGKFFFVGNIATNSPCFTGEIDYRNKEVK